MTVIFSPDSNNIVAMDAENGDSIAGDSVVWNKVDVDGIQAITPSSMTWSRSLSGKMTFNFDINVASDYKVLTRILTKGRDCWVWVEIDNNKQAIGPKNFGRLKHKTFSWEWSDGEDNATISLSAGRHTISLRSITSGCFIDRIALVPVGSANLTAGSSLVGPPENKDSGTPEEYVNTYAEWRSNPKNDPYRILLLELDHADDTLRVASRAWMSDENLPYYSRILSSPFLGYGLKENIGIGDIELINPYKGYDSENWLALDWRGYRCRWYFGDIRWKKSQFKRIAGATIENCRETSDRVYQFDLIGDSQKYDRTFHTGADLTQTMDAGDAIKWVMDQWENSGSYQYVGVDDLELDKSITFTVTESSLMYDVIKDISFSIEAYPVMAQTGFMDIVTPDLDNEPVAVFNESSFVKDSIRLVDTIHPVKRVTVTYNEGQDRLTDETAARTGSLDEEIVIDTLLSSQADAQSRLDKELEYYSNLHQVWEMGMIGMADVVDVGNQVASFHPRLMSSGVLTEIKREPLLKINSIEITT